MNYENEIDKNLEFSQEKKVINDGEEDMSNSSIIRLDDDDLSDELIFEIPLNVLKEKVLYCLPPATEVEEESFIVINKALNHFLKYFASKLPFQQDNEKKILIKDIKTCLDNDKNLSYLKKLIEK